MKVGDSIRRAIEDWELGELESAMLHACNAIDGTAKKLHPNMSGNQDRFTKVLRENYFILGPMAMPSINIAETRFPVSIRRTTTPDGKPDLADVIYSIHRCTHGHGDELPDGFALIPNAASDKRVTEVTIEQGSIRISDRAIFGLIAIAVLSPANVDQRCPDSYYLTFGAEHVLTINEWWGRANDFPSIAATDSLPLLKLGFADWMK